MNYHNLLMEIKNKVATVTLNRPEKRNALSSELMSELLYCLEQLKEDAKVNVLVIRGAGAAFCSGHDLSELVGKDSTYYRDIFDHSVRIMEVITNLPKAVIASVHGYVSAAGLQLAAACDLVVASEDSLFETPGVKIGLFCITPMVSLSRVVGRKKALELLLTGESIDAKEAERIGLVNRVVTRDKLEEATMQLAEKIASVSPVPVSFGKQAFYAAADMDYLKAFHYAKEMMVLNNLTEDAQEGIRAFIEKRTPRWKGR
jgi:enoyl-CoA hydratase/carnithine racemase